MKIYDIDCLLEDYSHHNKLALSRLMTLVENESACRDEIIERIHHLRKGAYRLGVTGPPGVGKSTIVSGMVRLLRSRGENIGVIAVDPSSPFTGGAFLGDRIRMSKISLDSGVYIRSLATRGSLGGLALAAEDVADLFDGFGCSVIVIETVGVGQAELDIVQAADSTLVTLIPGSGDSVQAMKAGLMEIGDIFILNKCDTQGAERAFIEIESALKFRPSYGWAPSIVKTVANAEKGMDDLLQTVESHRRYLQDNGLIEQKRLNRRRRKIRRRVEEKIRREFWDEIKLERLNELAEGNLSEVAAAALIISE